MAAENGVCVFLASNLMNDEGYRISTTQVNPDVIRETYLATSGSLLSTDHLTPLAIIIWTDYTGHNYFESSVSHFIHPSMPLVPFSIFIFTFSVVYQMQHGIMYSPNFQVN